MISKSRLLCTTAGLAIALTATPLLAQDVTLTIESWRNDDLTIWQNTLIPAFEAANPGITLNFAPTAPTEYNAALNAKLDAGSAGDLITCRPFDASLALFEAGYLAPLDDLEGISNFSDVAKSAWNTDDGSTPFCVPMASVIHGFIYNADAFAELGLEEPTTEEEFFAVLDAIQADGTYIPLAIGAVDQWESASMGYHNIGPAYWAGEEGRLALISGEAKFTDEEWTEPLRVLGRWGEYAGDGYLAQTYPDSQNLFTLGRAAIFPAGSWEIALFEEQADFELGAFPPPVPAEGDTCYISDHNDIGIGMNASTEHPEAARTFLNWVASAEFASLYANALPGFFGLSDEPVTIENELANEFVSWREECESTIRPTYAILSRGTPNLENDNWLHASNVLAGTETPEEAAAAIQSGLESWYTPGMFD